MPLVFESRSRTANAIAPVAYPLVGRSGREQQHRGGALESARPAPEMPENAMKALAEAGALIVSNAEFEYYAHK